MEGIPVFYYGGEQYYAGWSFDQYDDLMRATNIRLDLLYYRDGYNISFNNYAPKTIYLLRY